MKFNNKICIVIMLFVVGCKSKNPQENNKENSILKGNDLNNITATDSLTNKNEIPLRELSSLHDTTFIFIENWSSDFDYDMKYATKDNFIKQKVYECDQCMIRKEVAVALINANQEFMAIGYHIKFFDCYRPIDVQKIMWEVYPVEGYVANPYTSGSIHNRGGAVDITLVDEEGNQLDMGTDFDFFGEEAHHTFTDLPGKVIENRQVLKSIMEKHGFTSIRTEWWHYNFGQARKFTLSNFPTECD